MAPAGFAPSGFAAIAKKCCFRVDTDMPMLYRLLAWRWGFAELTPQNDFDTICCLNGCYPLYIVIHHIIPQKQRPIRKYLNERANVGSFHLSISKKKQEFLR